MERPWWNKRKIEWYERAANYSSFHLQLTTKIESYIKQDESIIELGCGLGYVAENLYNHGYSILAIDKDKDVIERAKKRSGLEIYENEDYRKTQEKRDIVLTIFFGRLWIDDNLSSLLRHGKKLISIHSLHSGQKDVENPRKTPSLSESISFLSNKDFKVRGEEITISFPQPLVSEEEAEEFIRESYPGKSLLEYEKYVKRTTDSKYPFVFTNDKKMVLLVIERPE